MSTQPVEEAKITNYRPPVMLEDFKEIERRDEAQIVEDLHGKAIDKLFYEFTQSGREIVALSWAGVKYFALQLGHISVEEVKIEEGRDSYKAIAWAFSKDRDLRVMGAAEQSKMLAFGNKNRDEFALAKVVSKAQRNALRNLLPETMISEAYKTWKAQRTKPPEKTPPF
jgi:hypothetical protein